MADIPDPTSARAGVRAFLALVQDIAAYAGRRGVLAAIYIAAGAVFESFGLLLLVPLLALVIGGGSGHGKLETVMTRSFAALGATTAGSRLAVLLGGFAVVMVARAAVITLRDSSVMNIRIGFSEHYQRRIAEALAFAGWDQVLRLRHARVISIMSGDVQRIAMAANYLLQAVIAVAILLAQCVLALALSPVLAMFAFALLVVGAVALIPVLERTRELGRFLSLTNMSLMDTTTQFLSGLKFAVSQDLQKDFAGEFRRTVSNLTARQVNFFRRQIMARSALTTLSALVGVAVFYFGYAVLALPTPILIAFLLVVGRMTGPAMQVQQGFQQLALGLPAYESIIELTRDLRTQAPNRTGAASRLPDGPLMLDHVSFRHTLSDGGEAQGVRSASLIVKPGTVLGIAGPSGSGKTTLADLIVGLLRPQGGRITVGGVALDDATLPAWRAQLSYISQDPFLFHDTIRRNLNWANPGAAEVQMWEALAVAGADAIVRRMEGGLDAIVGDRGTLVSGGERQRIAVARALLRKPRLLVMDEATNAIDIAGERQLLERLVAGARMTIVIIAHRAETLTLCDRVVRMEDGRLFDDDHRLAVAEV